MKAGTMIACVVFLIVWSAIAAAGQQPSPPPSSGTSVPAQSDRFGRTFRAWDTDHNGMLSLAEFESGWRGAGRRVEAIDARLRTQFNAADKNGDHGLDDAEYAALRLVRQAGSHAPPMSDFDGNHDRKLGYREYLGFVQRMATRRKVASGPAPFPKGK